MLESLDQEIRILRAQYWSARDPEGRGFAPLAEAYRLQGEFDEAASLVQDGLERLPGFLAGYLVASRIARDRGDLLGARDLLDQALELDAENVVARFERATLALEEGDREGSLADLRTVLDLDPLHQEAARHLDEIESGSEVDAVLSTESDLLPEPEAMEPEAIEPEVPDVTIEPEVLAPGAMEPEVLAPVTIEVAPTTAPAHLIGTDPSEPQDDEPDPALFTRTMGDLYAAQGFLDRAREVYRHLSARDPEDGDLRNRLVELNSRAGVEEGEPNDGAAKHVRALGGRILTGAIGDFELSERDRYGAGHGERTAQSYLNDILAWVPGAVPIASLAPDDLLDLNAPVPIGLLAPEDLGVPVPVELLAPDTEDPTSPFRDRGEEGAADSWLETHR